MNSFVINCFNFSLKPVCFFQDGTKITLPELNAEEILMVAKSSNSDSITLVGPTVITKKIKEDIEKSTDFNLKIKIILNPENGDV